MRSHKLVVTWLSMSTFAPYLLQNICYHLAALVIPFYLICNMTRFWKSWILTFYPTRPTVEYADKIFATMLLHSSFLLIWYAIWPCSEKLKFGPPPRVSGGGGGGGGSAGKIFATMLLHASFPLNLICNISIFWKSWILTPIPRVRGGGGGGGGRVCGQNICYHVAACVISFILICNMTIFWKSWILSSAPPPKSTQGVVPRPSI